MGRPLTLPSEPPQPPPPARPMAEVLRALDGMRGNILPTSDRKIQEVGFRARGLGPGVRCGLGVECYGCSTNLTSRTGRSRRWGLGPEV